MLTLDSALCLEFLYLLPYNTKIGKIPESVGELALLHLRPVISLLGLVFDTATHRHLLAVEFNLEFTARLLHSEDIVLGGYAFLCFHFVP